MRLGLTVVVAVLACGCAAASDGDFGDTDDFIDQDVPPGNCTAGTTGDDCPGPGTSGSPEGGPCRDSEDCASGQCIAPFIDGEVGDFTCTSQCIPLEDEGAWCVDDQACCDAGAVCSARGLCVIPEGGVDESGTTDGTAGDSGTTGGDTTGATDGTGTDGSGTDGSGSDTGAATGTTGMQ